MSVATIDKKDLGRLANNGMAVQSLQGALSKSETLSDTVPMLIKRLDRENGWREFLFSDKPDQVFHWNAAEFRKFIESPRPAGCETPLHILERMLHGTDAYEVFYRLTRGEPGGNNNPYGRAGKPEQEVINCDNVTVDSPDPTQPNKPPATGNSVSYAIRTLSRKRPDLYEKVKAGEMTANAAMVEGGFRETQITIPADPRKAARRLVKHLTREQFSELVDEALKHYVGEAKADK